MTAPPPGPASNPGGEGTSVPRTHYPSPPVPGAPEAVEAVEAVEAGATATSPVEAAAEAPVAAAWHWDGHTWRPAPSPTPAWLVPYRSAQGRAAWAMVGLAIEIVALGLPALLAVPFLLGILAAPPQPTDLLGGAFFAVGLLSDTTTLLSYAVVPALVAAWACLAYRNLAVLGGTNLRWSPGWAACGWFVPLANLVIPYLVIRELWMVTAGVERPPALVRAWGAAWLIRSALLTVAFLPVAVPGAGASLAFLAVVAIGASDVLSLLLVHRLTALQDARARQAAPAGAAPLPAWARPYAPARTHAGWAVAAIAVAALGGLLMLLVELAVLSLTAGPLVAGPAGAVAAWGVAALVSNLALAVAGPLAVALWAHRAYRNLPVLGWGPPRWSPGWAAGAWFVPVANLAVPYLVVRELWRGSRPPAVTWWVAWVVALGLRTLASYLHFLAGGAVQVTADGLDILGDGALVLAAALAIVGVVAITRGQDSRAAAAAAARG